MSRVTGPMVLVVAVAVAVAAAVGGGMRLMGSPSEARARALDDRRESDLRALSSEVRQAYARESRLPAAVGERIGSPGRRDPGTAQPYEYRVLDGTKYQLCATFQTSTNDEVVNEWSLFAIHPAGRHCVNIDVKTERP